MNKEKYVAVFYSLMPLAVMFELPADCSISKTDLSCQQSVPSQLPAEIHHVYIIDYTAKYIKQGMFAHSSWKSVKQFDINANIEMTLFITDYAFLGLHNMTSLGIHARKGNMINEKAFVGINCVEKLDLSNMIALEPETLIKPLMYENVLPNLRILILENVNTERLNFNFNFSRSFVHMLSGKRIMELCLRGTNLFIERNANDVSTWVEILDVSNVSFSVVKGFQWDSMFPNLKSVNISRPVTRYFSNIRLVKGTTEFCYDESPLFRNLEMLYANFYFHDKEVYIDNVTWNISPPCFEQIKVLHIRGSSVHFLNVTAHWPNCSLFELDMSSNKMEFLSANFLKDMINLQHLYLGDNSLSTMSYHPHFQILFQPLRRLRKLSLAYNQIAYIPKNIFCHNLDLEWLDLQGNYLMSTSFLHVQLSNIMFLNISDNRIAYITGEDLENLQTIVMRKESKIQEIKMNGNPFECSCQSVNFIEWINMKPLNDNLRYSCYLGQQTTTINDKSISKAKFLCIRTIVYILSSVLSVVVTLALFITFLLTGRYFYRKRRAARLMTFLQNFRENLLRKEFLCFLSYNESDSEVSDILYEKLKSLLRDITDCERDSICIDYRHFRLGASIVEETMRCISESHVAVFVVSEAFCQSKYCCLEVKEAQEQQIPIILIFVEEVSEEIMPLYFRSIFKRYTRCKLVPVDGEEVDILPGGINRLCNSILLSASENERNVMFVNNTRV